MTDLNANIEALLTENRSFLPPPKFVRQANVNDPVIYEQADANFEEYWSNWATQLDWFKKWNQTLDWNPPFAKWFINGKLNVSYNCLDRHLQSGRRNKAALIWEGEPGDWKVYTFGDLHREVCRFANGLKSLGVQKGDRITMYMPMIPELAIAMLACARIGAPHSIVFGGFSSESLRDRINDCGSKILITADGGYRRGQIIPLKRNADEALESTPSIEKSIVVKRIGKTTKVDMKSGRDIWWEDLVKDAPYTFEAEQMDSEDMLFVLYTSGTTGKPKGVVHTTGGYLTGVYATTKWVFDLKDDDVYWCTADIGWITGHSYIVYGPLANGATTVMYEGSPDFPDKDRFWDIIEKYRCTILYTAPTAIRACMRWGEEYPAKHDLSSLRLLGTVGEPINPEAWIWYHTNVGGSRCPIVDTWWQTETGSILITPLAGLTTTIPGSATKPFPGIRAEVWDANGNPVLPGNGGYLVLTRPWPSMIRTIYGDNERFKEQYWTKYPNTYFTGDGAKIDENGYIWVLGRVDDVINVAGHRISTMEVESALVDHSSVAEAASIGRSDSLKGQAVVSFVILKDAISSSKILEDELKAHVTKKIGAIARPDKIFFTADLPKTRSGKIMRRLLRDIAEGHVLGDTTTLADASAIELLKDQYEDAE